jgi:hypothetical protein
VNTVTLVGVLVGSNVGCLFLGYLFGRMARATVQIEETMTTDDTADVPAAEPAPVPVDAYDRRNAIVLRILAAVVAVVGIVTATMGYVVIRNQDRIVGCVVGYSNASSAAFKARAAAQNDVNTQMDNFMAAILQAFSSAPAEGRQLVFDAVTAYNQSRADAKTAQAKNPLPEPPEHACAELMD